MSGSGDGTPSAASIVVKVVGDGLDRHAAEALGIELIRLVRCYGVEPSGMRVRKGVAEPEGDSDRA